MYRIKLLQSDGYKTIVGFAMVIMFVSTLFFGLAHIINMPSMVVESSCPVSLTGGSVCPADVSDHLSLWQSLSLAAPIVLFLLLLLVPFVRTLFTSCSQLFKQFLQVWEIVPLAFLMKQLEFISVPNYLEELFSNGTLHPKLF